MKTEAPEEIAELRERTYTELQDWVARDNQLIALWRSIFITPPGEHRDTLEALARRMKDDLCAIRFGGGNSLPLKGVRINSDGKIIIGIRERLAALMVYEQFREDFRMPPRQAREETQVLAKRYGNPALDWLGRRGPSALRLREWSPWLEQQIETGRAAVLHDDMRPELTPAVLAEEMWSVWHAEYAAQATQVERLSWLLTLMLVFADDPLTAIRQLTSEAVRREHRALAKTLAKAGRLDPSQGRLWLERQKALLTKKSEFQPLENNNKITTLPLEVPE